MGRLVYANKQELGLSSFEDWLRESETEREDVTIPKRPRAFTGTGTESRRDGVVVVDGFEMDSALLTEAFRSFLSDPRSGSSVDARKYALQQAIDNSLIAMWKGKDHQVYLAIGEWVACFDEQTMMFQAVDLPQEYLDELRSSQTK